MTRATPRYVVTRREIVRCPRCGSDCCKTSKTMLSTAENVVQRKRCHECRLMFIHSEKIVEPPRFGTEEKGDPTSPRAV